MENWLNSLYCGTPGVLEYGFDENATTEYSILGILVTGVKLYSTGV